MMLRLAALLLLAALTPAWAQDVKCPFPAGTAPVIDSGKLTMSINPTSPPNQSIDEHGKYVGTNIDLGNEIARRLCLAPAYMNIPFEAQIPGLQNRRWDMIDTSMYYTAERAKIMQLIPYSVQALAIVVPFGNPGKIAGLKDLAGKVVGVEIGGFEERNLRAISADQAKAGLAPLDIRVFNTYGDTYQALQAGQLEAVFTGDATGKYYQERGRFTMAATGLIPGTAVALATTDAKLAQAVADVLNGMLADGSYKRLMDQWGATQLDHWDKWPGSFKVYATP